MRGIGQVAKLPGVRAEVRLTRVFGTGKAPRRRCGRERGVEVTVREQQGWRMKHENRESEMERYDMRTANTLEPCVYAMSVRHARKTCKENVRATRSVCSVYLDTHIQDVPMTATLQKRAWEFAAAHLLSERMSESPCERRWVRPDGQTVILRAEWRKGSPDSSHKQ